MISLVVVTFNRCGLLLELLKSAQAQSVRPDHVFIVDNDSSDGTAGVVETFREQNGDRLQVSYYNTGSNLGGAGGFAYGAKLAYYAGYEWVWLVDDDVLLEPECLAVLTNYPEDAKILQPLRVNHADGTCAEVSGIDYKLNSPFRLNPKRKTVEDVANDDWSTYPLKTIPFEGPLIHRSVFEKVGFPNPEFFIFYDDLDFALRAQQAGFDIICVRNAVIRRQIPFVQSRALGSWKGYFMYRNFFKVQLSYAKKPVAWFRVLSIFTLVFGLYTVKLDWKAVKMIRCALRDACDGEFPTDDTFFP